jgi:hypothetical protein
MVCPICTHQPWGIAMRSIGGIWRGCLALVVVAGIGVACSDTNPVTTSVPEGPQVSQGALKRITTAASSSRAVKRQNVGEAGGVISIEGGHSIYFPPGALPHVTEIYTERAEGMHIQIQFGPAGLRFPAGKKAVLTLDYSTAVEPTPETMAITYVDADGTILRVLQTQIDTQNNKLIAEIDGFSRYAAAQ